MEEKGTKEVFERAKESWRRDGEGIGVWQVAEHGDWLEIGRDELKEEVEVGDVGVSGGASVEDVELVVQGFRERHPEIGIALGEDKKINSVELPAPANMVFHIEARHATDGRPGYSIRNEGRTKLQQAVTETINERLGSKTLSYLLVFSAVYGSGTEILMMNRTCSLHTKTSSHDHAINALAFWTEAPDSLW
ncbi:MAG: hypothetical protein Q9217_006697 [Psora testacea]